MASPYKPRFFLTGDLFFIGMCLWAATMATWATLTPGNPLVGVVMVWFVVASFIAITILMYVKRAKVNKTFHFTSNGMVVGWEEDQYSVKEEEFDLEILRLRTILLPKFPDISKSMTGCIVYFMEPVFVSQGLGWVARKVCGLQDDFMIYVGWKKNLRESALTHELTHRVFQVFSKDPNEKTAHEMMKEFGV